MLRRLVISGGGTGGHIFPAIAIADAVKRIDPDVEILFVGAEGKMEMEKVPKAGYRIIGLPIAGIQRRLTAANLKLPVLLLRSLRKAGAILRDFDPQVVVGVGGYASGPLLWQATRKHIPTLIQEQNSYPGLTNRWLGKRVDRICVAYEGMDTFFPRKKMLLAGNPVRQDLVGSLADKNAALTFFGLDQNKKTLLIFGGSLGARTLNKAMADHVELLKDTGIQVLWQTGKGQYDAIAGQFSGKNSSELVRLPFIDRMDLAYTAADLVVSRAGALTLAELAVIGKAAILVPSPNVTADHQTHNALAFVKQGAAEMVSDDDALAKLIPRAIALLQDQDELKRLAENMAAQARPDAADRIAKEVFALAGKNES